MCNKKRIPALVFAVLIGLTSCNGNQDNRQEKSEIAEEIIEVGLAEQCSNEKILFVKNKDEETSIRLIRSTWRDEQIKNIKCYEIYDKNEAAEESYQRAYECQQEKENRNTICDLMLDGQTVSYIENDLEPYMDYCMDEYIEYIQTADSEWEICQ